MSNTYNGWTNYATWRVNLECFDGFNPLDYWDDLNSINAYELGDRLKDNVEEYLFNTSLNDSDYRPTLVESYARAFLSDVNWIEIASSMLETYKDEVSNA